MKSRIPKNRNESVLFFRKLTAIRNASDLSASESEKTNNTGALEGTRIMVFHWLIAQHMLETKP